MRKIIEVVNKLSDDAFWDLLLKRTGIVEVINNVSLSKRINGISSINEAKDGELIWINNENCSSIINSTLASFIICNENLKLEGINSENKLIITTKEPRLFFILLLTDLLNLLPKVSGIHASAVIHPECEVGSNVFVGANSVIGQCKIGNDVYIAPNVTIYDDCVIGNNVKINSGTVIGADGFGYARNKNREFQKFPHIGGVIIEDNVDIGANTCIDKGTLANTIIRTGAKIDNLVHIAHNVSIGEHSAVIANAMVAGSTVIGDYSWIAPSASIIDGITIGDGATIGLGAVVTKSVDKEIIVTGNPAKTLTQLSLERNALKKLIKNLSGE